MPATLGSAYVQILPTTKGIEEALAKTLGEAFEKVSGSSDGLSVKTVALGNAMANAFQSGAEAIKGFAGSSIQAGMDFDAAMAQVAATSGKSVEEIQDLRDFAKEMGSTTAFSATQAAEALNYMALAGYNSEASMSMLPNVLNLAAAGGMELAAASDMVTDSQSALGLTMDETTAMVDKMARASSVTNTSVAQLGDAILTVGGTAKNLSGGTTELATVLGLMADNGIKASEGGTHLRNILLAMTPATDAAAGAWKALGVSGYDADGNLRPLEDTFGDLSAAMEGMSTKDRTDMISAMFNKTDISAVNALLSTSSDRWEEVAAAIDESQGAAEAMAETQLDNLTGDVTLFQSALEGAQIAVSEKLTPILRDLVQFGTAAMTDLTTDGTTLNSIMDGLGVASGLVADGVGFIGDNLNIILPTLGAVATAVGTVTAGITLHNAAVAVKTAMTATETSSVWGLVSAMAAQAAAQAAVLLPYIAIAAAVAALIAVIALCIKHWDSIRRAMSQTAQTVKGAVLNAFNSIKSGVSTAVSAVWSSVSNSFSKIGSTVSSMAERVRSSAKTAFDGVKNAASTALNGAKSIVESILNAIRTKFSNTFDTVKNTVSNALSKIKNMMNFSWSLPKLKLPHFSVSGGKAPWGFGGAGSLPSVGVSWYAKAMDNAMVLDSPTIFGANAQGLLGGGEAGREIVAGASLLEDMIQKAVEKGSPPKQDSERPIVITVNSVLDGKVIGQDVVRYIRRQTFTTGENPLAGTF